ncbi:SAM-dependent methyltransferase [Actinomycetaceae bacterium L2_0104]
MVPSITPLLRPEGRALLDSLPTYDSERVLSLTNRLRAEGYSPELVSLALTQSRLRMKAAGKFGIFAQSMFFTPAGLEQSTRLDVGAHHAARLRRAGATHVVDLGCGIGADSLAMAGLGLRVTAIEEDAETAAAAQANLTAFPEAQVITGDGLDIELERLGADALWLDPARRDATGRRLKDPEQWSPRLSTAYEIAAAFPAAGIKVAPGISHGLCPSASHVQWISQGSDLLEAVIWMGEAAFAPGRSALILRDGRAYDFDSGAATADAPVEPLPAAELAEFLYEPDPAIIRSGAIARLCTEYGLAPVSHNIAYLTNAQSSQAPAPSPPDPQILGSQAEKAATPEPPPAPYAARFRVLEVLPLEVKAIRKALSRKGISRLEIKKRGTDVDPEQLRRKLGLRKAAEGGDAVLILTPLMGRHRAVVAERA